MTNKLKHKTHSKVYIDLGEFGVPTENPSVLLEIKDLLSSLDPANDAKSLAHNSNGDAVDISLVMNADLANTLQQSFSDTQLMSYLENLGITEIIGLDPNITGSVTTSVAQTPIPLPEVKIIGSDNALFDELNHNKLV
jgi:hypothetical protein